MTKKAFAYIELFAILALIAIMIGIIIPYYIHMKYVCNSRVVLRELRILKTAVNSYYENRKPKAYPLATSNLCAEYLLYTKPQIIKNILYDPFAKGRQGYHYAVSPGGKSYCIWSVGIDRRSDIEGVDDTGEVAIKKNSKNIYLTTMRDL